MRIENLGTPVVNNYMIPVENGYLLIDTGYENHFPAFCRKLQKRKLRPADIAYVFLTHAHDDHGGFLNELLQHSPARVILSEKAVPALENGQNSFQGNCSGRLALFFCKAMALAGRGNHRFPPIEKQFRNRYLFVNEQTRPGLERDLSAKIVETPGHTSCSLSLLLENGALFCGDAAMNGFPSLNRTTIWIENLNEFCRSWEKIITLGPKRIYPGHGRPFFVSDLERFLPKVKTLQQYPLPDTQET